MTSTTATTTATNTLPSSPAQALDGHPYSHGHGLSPADGTMSARRVTGVNDGQGARYEMYGEAKIEGDKVRNGMATSSTPRAPRARSRSRPLSSSTSSSSPMARGRKRRSSTSGEGGRDEDPVVGPARTALSSPSSPSSSLSLAVDIRSDPQRTSNHQTARTLSRRTSASSAELTMRPGRSDERQEQEVKRAADEGEPYRQETSNRGTRIVVDPPQQTSAPPLSPKETDIRQDDSQIVASSSSRHRRRSRASPEPDANPRSSLSADRRLSRGEDLRNHDGRDRSTDDPRRASTSTLTTTSKQSLSLNASDAMKGAGVASGRGASPNLRAHRVATTPSPALGPVTVSASPAVPSLLLPTGIYNLSRSSPNGGTATAPSRHHGHHHHHQQQPPSHPASPHLTPNGNSHRGSHHHLLSPVPHATATLPPISAASTIASHIRRTSSGSASPAIATAPAAASGTPRENGMSSMPAQHQNNPYPPPPALRPAQNGALSLHSTVTAALSSPAMVASAAESELAGSQIASVVSGQIGEDRGATLLVTPRKQSLSEASPSNSVRIKMEPGVDVDQSVPSRSSPPPPPPPPVRRSLSPSQQRPALHPSHSSSSTTWTRPDLVDVPHHPHHGVTNVDLTSKGKRRKRLAKACDSCHKNKRRCDGFEPCENCTHNGRECHYKDSNGNKVSAPKSSRRQPSFSAVSKPQHEVRTTVAQPTAPLMESKPSHGDDLASLRERLADRERALAALQAELDRKLVEEAMRKPHRLAPRPIPAPRFREEQFVAAAEADIDLTEDLLRLFFSRLHPHTLMFHRATFDHRRYLGRTARPLLLAMYALAAPLCDHPMLATRVRDGEISAAAGRSEPFALTARRSLRDWLTQRKRAAFFDGVWEETEMAMAACLLAAYETTIGRAPEDALKLCRDVRDLVGFDLAPDCPDAPSPEELTTLAETRNRLLWTLFLVEFHFGRNSYDVGALAKKPLPGAEASWQLFACDDRKLDGERAPGSFAYLVQLLGIYRDILQLGRMAPSDPATASDYQDVKYRFELWGRSLPAALHLSASNTERSMARLSSTIHHIATEANTFVLMRLLGAACQYRLIQVARDIKRKTFNEVREIQWKAVDSMKEVLDKVPSKVRRSPTITFILALLDEWIASEQAVRGYSLPEPLASWPRDVESWWLDIKRIWGIQPERPNPRIYQPQPVKAALSPHAVAATSIPVIRRTGALSEILHETSVEPTAARQTTSPVIKRPLASPVERPNGFSKRHRPTPSPEPPLSSGSTSRMSIISTSSSHGGMSALFQAIDMTNAAADDGRRRGVSAA